MKKNILLLITLLLVTGGCASLTRSRKSARISDTDKSLTNPDFEEIAVEGSGDEEDDSNELTTVENGPEDLGDVAASQDRQASEIEADRQSSMTFPLVQNEFVDQWVRYFSGRGNAFFSKWLARSTRYIPLMKEVLRKEGVPEDLIYLSMIESGFNTKAKSRAKAVGPWQFIKGTGDRYDLDVSFWIDERRDFIKSTVAAAQYLKELYQIFGSWYLAAAGYNAGEGKVLMAVRRDRSRNFWELIRAKANFRAETRNYVPKIIAAALVSKNPKKYGFDDLQFEEPFQWETITVPGGVRLKQVASIISSDEDTMELLNPQFRRMMTPPGKGSWELRIPLGTQKLLQNRIGELTSHSRGFFATHKVKRGESLGSIARRYGANVQEIMDLNNIAKVTRLKVGQELSIPQPESRSSNVSRKASKKNPFTGTVAQAPIESEKASVAGAARDGEYTVQNGDSLWSLSRKHNVTVDELKKANNLHGKKDLRSGMKITIPKKAGTGSYQKIQDRRVASKARRARVNAR